MYSHVLPFCYIWSKFMSDCLTEAEQEMNERFDKRYIDLIFKFIDICAASSYDDGSNPDSLRNLFEFERNGKITSENFFGSKKFINKDRVYLIETQYIPEDILNYIEVLTGVKPVQNIRIVPLSLWERVEEYVKIRN